MPKLLDIFKRFYTNKTLEKICEETNRYSSIWDAKWGWTKGGPNWWSLEVDELLAFLGITIFMGIKVLPSHRDYWKRSEPFLYCPIISQVMSRGRFESIGRYLHVVKDDDDDPDKL
jgi:hypothetical protein